MNDYEDRVYAAIIFVVAALILGSTTVTLLNLWSQLG